MIISDWSSDVCSSDLRRHRRDGARGAGPGHRPARAAERPARAGHLPHGPPLRPPPGRWSETQPKMECSWPMALALREIRRAKARFGLLIAAVGLLMFLILTQQALQSGLITAFVGGLEKQSAPVLVYSVDRSEEHTSELQSLMRISYAVFCLKKKTTN